MRENAGERFLKTGRSAGKSSEIKSPKWSHAGPQDGRELKTLRLVSKVRKKKKLPIQRTSGPRQGIWRTRKKGGGSRKGCKWLRRELKKVLYCTAINVSMPRKASVLFCKIFQITFDVLDR